MKAINEFAENLFEKGQKKKNYSLSNYGKALHVTKPIQDIYKAKVSSIF